MSISLIISLSSDIEEDLSLLRSSFIGEETRHSSLRWRAKYRHFLLLHSIISPRRGEQLSRTILAELDLTLSQMHWSEFSLRLKNVFITPPTPHASFSELSVGVEKNTFLEQLHQRLANRLRRLELALPPQRYRPHLPLAQAPFLTEGRAIRWVQRHNLFHSRRMEVNSLHLIENFGLYEENPYNILACYPSDKSRHINDSINSPPMWTPPDWEENF